ncbi:MAG: hypothetical protein GY816_23675 [Cytophagales bacterium]|nr:hypothetical protein [Cytophagales bacterium]
MKAEVENYRKPTLPKKKDFKQKPAVSKPAPKKVDQKEEFESFVKSGKIDDFIVQSDFLLRENILNRPSVKNAATAIAFGLLEAKGTKYSLSQKGQEFFKWKMLDG